MRTAFLVFGLTLVFVSVSAAMPVAALSSVSKASQIHGCHQYYDHDPSGRHRHDDACNALRGLVSGKNRNPAKY
jgi:hypothetical protein